MLGVALRVSKRHLRGISYRRRVTSCFLLVCTLALTGCATKYNLRRDLVSVPPQGTLTISDMGDEQMLLMRGAAFPAGYNNAVFRDRSGARLPLDSTTYAVVLNDYGSHGLLWIDGKESQCRYAPCFELEAPGRPNADAVRTNAVVLRMTAAKVRRYTSGTLAKKLLLTPVMLICDILSLGMTGWVYADENASVAGQYEFRKDDQSARAEDVRSLSPEGRTGPRLNMQHPGASALGK